ncbi:TraB/GumN family protein [Massilia sp. LXY-6]|uniref:TraB/GumN family protein n=1 Tax=Massilia sp. LXY-6 TaxID=3379823 RepID=UPI003EE18563
MRRPLFALLCSLFWLVVPTVSAAERGALFRVSLEGHDMYLFGTLHVGLPEFYPLEPRIVEALNQSSTLALEIDPAQPQRELQRVLHARGMLEPGAVGYDSMDPDRRSLLDSLIVQGGYDPTNARKFKPVLLATLLTMAEYTKQGYRSDLSSEAWLARHARANATRVLELESLDRQLSMLDRLSVPERWRFLDEMMGTIESGAQRVEARDMVQAWSNADRAALDRIAMRCDADTSVSGKFVTQVLLKERNRGLADGLLNLLRQEKRTFAAIGVLHLLGKGSVPELLQARGVSVERIY